MGFLLAQARHRYGTVALWRVAYPGLDIKPFGFFTESAHAGSVGESALRAVGAGRSVI